MALEDAKRQVRKKFLGVNGIHAVGLRRQSDSVTVYVLPGWVVSAGLLQDIEAEASPFSVLLVSSDAASVRGG